MFIILQKTVDLATDYIRYKLATKTNLATDLPTDIIPSPKLGGKLAGTIR